MICHVVLIRLKDDVTEERSQELLTQAKAVLGPIPGVRNLRVGKGMGIKADVRYPFALVMDFDDEAALDAYQVHPEHQRFVHEILGPIGDDKQVYDYWA